MYLPIYYLLLSVIYLFNPLQTSPNLFLHIVVCSPIHPPTYHFKPLPIYSKVLWFVHPFTHPPITSNLFQSIPRYCGLFTHSPTHLSTPSQEANTQTVERAQSLCHILCLLLFLISCYVICRPAYICSWYTITVSVSCIA